MPKVIIIGAGISGLSAANELIENGVEDILVLEALNRVGGRTYTVEINNKNYIEFGAQWIHGKGNNPLYDFASSIGVADEDTKTIVGEKMYFATETGEEVDEDYVDSINDKVDDLFERLKDESTELESDRSVGDLLEENYSKMVSELELDEKQAKIVRAIYDARIKEEKNDTACDDMNQLSAMGWNAFEDSGGDDMINLRNGYREIVDYFKNKITDSRIQLNKVVKKIVYPEEDGGTIEIHVEDRAAKKQVKYEADYCLITMPLGYLKTVYKTLFEPELPSPKANAIERLGFGIVDKLFLIFDGPVFKESVQGLQVLWLNDVPFELNAAKKWGFSDEFYKSAGTFELSNKMNNVLYGFVTGDDALLTEKLSDECLIDVFNEIFKKCFPNVKLPPIKKIIRSRWGSEEFFRGAYSHIAYGANVEDVEALAEPVNSKLFFAGEATSLRFVSTVHGAYETGLREAQNILKAIGDH